MDASRPHALTRRGLLVSGGAAAVGISLASLYGRLAVGDRFEGLVATKLGLDEAQATALLRDLRDRLGDRSYDLRASAFAAAVREPVASLLPARLRRDAIEGLVGPLLAPPSSLVAFGTGRRDRSAAGCAGLIRSA